MVMIVGVGHQSTTGLEPFQSVLVAKWKAECKRHPAMHSFVHHHANTMRRLCCCHQVRCAHISGRSSLC